MARLVDTLGLKGNPFEHYVAETEPHIADYAVKPPYFEAIDARANNANSYILFGDRGAGKSATRLTVFKELWARKAKERVPLAVNLTDFSTVLQGRNFRGLSEEALVKEVAFVVIESLLAWLSSLEDDDRAVYVEAMTEDERQLCYKLLRDHYVAQPEARRKKSAREAMQLLNQALIARNRLWIERRWEAISGIVARVVEKWTGADGTADLAKSLMANQPKGFDSVLLLHSLVDFVNIFNFSGVVILIDKVDETEATSYSADQTAALVHPLLARVQLMEVEGFSWIFFLWSKVKGIFENTKYPVRLDKIGHATVTWDNEFFSLMLDKRVQFYSEGRFGLAGLFVTSTFTETTVSELVRASMRSPRELIRLMDVIIREHDIADADSQTTLLDNVSIDQGLDKYAKDVVSTIYDEHLLAQIYRLNKVTFTNRDVQSTFRIGQQPARNRIRSWEDAGIVKLTGTRAAEGAQGGKPANEYTIIDARVERVMRRELVQYSDDVTEEPELEEQEEEI
jgi:hypothetical protein